MPLQSVKEAVREEAEQLLHKAWHFGKTDGVHDCINRVSEILAPENLRSRSFGVRSGSKTAAAEK